ncbi:OmpA family protein [Melittangium boletus]|uniref:OmpA family protein n=1 Tax=Melittangium boletus TaxID=83453 RepID=UPI003DA3ABDE
MSLLTSTRVVFLATVLSGASAWAQASLPGFALERLELNSGRGSLVSGNGELLPEGGFRLGMAGQYQHLPFVLRNGTQRLELVRGRASTVLAGSYGLFSWLELGLQLPVVLWQHGENPGNLGLTPLTPAALDTPVLQARLGVLAQRHEQPVDLSVDLGVGLPLGSGQALASDSGLRFRARATVGRRVGWIHPALEAGVLVRPRSPLAAAGSSQSLEVRGGALATTTGEGLRGELAVRGAFAADTGQSSLELLGGVRLPLSPAFDLSVLGGPGLGSAPGTPIARVLVGLNFRSEPPPALERLAEAVPQFRLEEANVPSSRVVTASVLPVPTRELLPPHVAAEPLRADTGAPPALRGTVRFEPGGTALAGDQPELRQLLPLLRALPAETTVLIEGQPELEARDASDRLLPLRRAQALRHHLAAQGVPMERMQARVSGTNHVEVLVTGGAPVLSQETP